MKIHFGFLMALVLVFAPALSAQNVKVNNGSLSVGGFISTTFYAQDQSFGFGNGQNAEFPTGSQFQTSKWFYDNDVRNTRLWLNFSGPEVGDGWKANAYIEADFFGGNNGNSFASAEQLIPRLRMAYAELVKNSLTIRIGQWWSPLFGYVPVSMSHIAFPLGYGSAGFPGWRFPGIFIYYTLTQPGASTTAQLQFAAMKPSWFTAPGAGNTDLNSGMTAGNASGVPQLEARLNLDGKISKTSGWGSYIVVHYDRKNLSGLNERAGTTLNGWAGEIGAKYDVDGFSIAGNGYYGEAIGQQFGLLTQNGDLRGGGGWAQVGYDFNPHWGACLFYGIDHPENNSALRSLGAAARWQNQIVDGLVRYKIGPYALGLEWLHAALKSGLAGSTQSETRSHLACYTSCNMRLEPDLVLRIHPI
ncbi:MAG: hypothetical protein M1395_00985 [Bacteroidetes bacterium]|nr:hypothetical protein [Bacteroidota bacterium]